MVFDSVRAVLTGGWLCSRSGENPARLDGRLQINKANGTGRSTLYF